MRSPTLAAPATGALSVSLGSATEFSITADACTGTALGPGKSCNVTVRFAPTTDGQTTATLAANGTKPPSSTSITLTGTGLGTGPGDLVLLPPALFENIDQDGTKNYFYDFGTGATQNFTVRNQGTVASDTLGFFIAGPYQSLFVLSNDLCTNQALAPGAECSFQLTFTAPDGCTPGFLFDAGLEVVDQPNNLPPYIVLDMHGSCP